MGQITTVLGNINSESLGVCQPHEHIYIVDTIALLSHEELRISNFPASVNELTLYRKVGGCSMVDAQPIGTGRDARALKEASRLSGINIVASTGYHLPFFYPQDHWVFTTDIDKLVELFITELTKGMYLDGAYFWPEIQSYIPAGLVKAEIGEKGVVERDAQLLKAAGQAAVETGTSLMLHTESGKGALDAIQLLNHLGLPSNRILIAHADRQVEELSIHRDIADAGVYMEYDTITMFSIHDNTAELRLLQFMIKEGYLKQLLLSTDPTVDRLKSYGAPVGMDYILTIFIPLLKKNGFGREEIRTITVENPRRALEKRAISGYDPVNTLGGCL
jgi:phosphotriesterase-related protein